MRRGYFIALGLCLLSLQACAEPVPNVEPPAATSAAPVPAIASPSPTVLPPTPVPEAVPIPLADRVSPEDLASYFEDYTNAAMLLSDGISQVAYNASFAKERHSPYSTFKIPNSLIALEEGVISVGSSTRQWDGTAHNRPELNQDQDLASAMKHSCVWYYQELAKEVGSVAMRKYLENIGYGNMDISGGIDSFWLGSSLAISPEEQLDFIIRLYHNDLPFSDENMDYVKSILRQDGYPLELYGKTGSSGRKQGWFVGYVLLDGAPCFFTTYIEGKDVSGLLAREDTVKIIVDLLIG